ncbi:MAG: response regulator transcription factor [Rhodospirillaceae bacterium]
MAAARLLCIDDEQRILDLLVEELRDHGFEVRGLTVSARAIEEVLAFKPDLVICDIMMPPPSGFELLEQLRARTDRIASIPFVFLSALSDRVDVLKGRRLGADDYVTKPIDFEMLAEIVKSRLNRTPVGRPVPPKVSLTEREIEALAWSAQGKSSTDIAVLMSVSERTVNFHITNAMRKLGVATRIQAAVKASIAGLIPS